jgi:putative acetyltransferase
VNIRPERPDDFEAVAQVERADFGGPAEANLVNRLRELSQLAASLVAVSGTRVVGHIAFSPIIVSPNPEALRAVGLAPLAVLPAHQMRGIASQLVRAGLRWDRDAAAGTFTVAELRPGVLGEASGMARYHAAFDEL